MVLSFDLDLERGVLPPASARDRRGGQLIPTQCVYATTLYDAASVAMRLNGLVRRGGSFRGRPKLYDVDRPGFTTGGRHTPCLVARSCVPAGTGWSAV